MTAVLVRTPGAAAFLRPSFPQGRAGVGDELISYTPCAGPTEQGLVPDSDNSKRRQLPAGSWGTMAGASEVQSGAPWWRGCAQGICRAAEQPQAQVSCPPLWVSLGCFILGVWHLNQALVFQGLGDVLNSFVSVGTVESVVCIEGLWPIPVNKN